MNEEEEANLTGDLFRNNDEDEAAAQERRRKRRKRLAEAAEKDNSDHAVPNPAVGAAVVAHHQPPLASDEVPTNRETKESDDDGGFDMFSKSVSPQSPEQTLKDNNKLSTTTAVAERGHEQQDWDDAEGYYKAVIGEEIQFEQNAVILRVAGVIGKGVFSTVLKCHTVSNSTSYALPPVVAIKCIRHNESMMKAANSELEILLKLSGAPGIVPLLLPKHRHNVLEHRGHFVFVFDYMEYNLRDVLQKFGKGVGVSLQAVRSYFGQMIAAASHLQKHKIIHADLKPDNILVSSDFAVIQLADFGSAYEQGEDIPTPYLVSRFYRAPEIILGLKPTFAIDLWSLAVTVGELFLGEVLFKGHSNNDMLYVFMQTLGPIPNRVIRQHLVQSKKFGLPMHFQQQPGAAFYFAQDTVDPVSGTKVVKLLSLVAENNERKFPNATPLATLLRKAQSQSDSREMVESFMDLLKQSLNLDPTRRIALQDALRHKFFSSS